MQYRHERKQSGPTGAYKTPTKRRTVEIEKLTRQMQYRHEIEHAAAMLAPAKRRTVLNMRKRFDAV